MTEVSRVRAVGSIGLDELLLDTKLAIPPPRAGFVSRADLVLKARGADCRVVAVTAPAGYGKSSLLAQWAAVEERPVIWVSLDKLDDDPVTLLSLLAAGYSRAMGTAPDLVAGMRGNPAAALSRAAPRLASVLRSSPTPFVIMLDDLHQVRSPASEDVLSVVISGVPAGSQFVAASRYEQPHVARLRAEGDTIEFGVDDLALDVTGAHQIFAEARIDLTPDLASRVVERTEGWPIGIHLAAVIARDTSDAAATITGDDRYVADYLYRESLGATSPEVQAFLRRTAILDRFSAPLCDALLQETTSGGLLRDLEDSNVFLVPLDRRRQWYRYHPLFREFLLGELARVEPEAAEGLHVRAADWYEVNGAPGLAIEHLLATQERARCQELVERFALPTFSSGQMETVQRWIDALGSSVVMEYPPLAVIAGWIALMSGRAEETVRWSAAIEGASFAGVPAEDAASFESGRAMLRAAMCAHGAENAWADARLAVELEPPFGRWRDQALKIAGEVQLLLGQTQLADDFFAEAFESATLGGNHDGFALAGAERAIINMDHGRWGEAKVQIDASLAAIESAHLHDYATAAVAFAAAARHALHRGDRGDLDRELTRGMRARPSCTYAVPMLAVRVRLMLAKSYWAIADHATARHLVHEIDDVMIHRPDLGVLVDEVAGFKEIIQSSDAAGAGGSPLTPAELRLLPYLQTHLTFPEIGVRLFISRNTVATQVGSIYRKLGVSSRAAAVERATAIGLLGD